MDENIKYMRRAIALAKRGEGFVNPNPLVGAVLVKENKVIGEGYHHEYGKYHAEREAINDCINKGASPSGSTLYVTLTPCCHIGRQPACTALIIESKIKSVIIGSTDPNPLVKKSLFLLRQAGITVQEGVLKEECDKLNAIFFYYITTHLPYIALKIASTIDGKVATKTGESKWITGKEARKYCHKLRNRYAAILVGSGTLLNDDPMLDCRLGGKVKNPLRIVCDTRLRVPISCKIVKSAARIKSIIFYGKEFEDKSKLALLSQAGIECQAVKTLEDGHIDLLEVVKELGRRQIDSVLVEGGGEINYSFLRQGLVRHIYHFTAPLAFGGLQKPCISGEGTPCIKDAFYFCTVNVKRVGEDVLVEYDRK